MVENSPVQPSTNHSNGQSTEVPSSPIESNNSNSHPPKKSISKNFRDVFAAGKLYDEYEPYAKNVKILIQMLIGIILGLFLLLKVFANIFDVLGIQFLHPLAIQNPLNIVAYGLFFSTGIDLAYMLFTDGPDEAIDPLMTGLGAAILLGIAKIDFQQVQQGITLFLAVGALAGLFATKKYIFNSLKKDNE